MLIAILFLIASALIGVRLINSILSEYVGKTEQTFFGIIVGWMTSIVCGYVIADGIGRLTFSSVLIFALIILLIAVGVWIPAVGRLRNTKFKFHFQFKHFFLILLFLIFAPLFYYLFSIRMFYPQPDGLYSGGNSWNDMSLHLAISSAFFAGDNFPPASTIYAGEPLRYPFMPDFQTAILMTFGLSPFAALMLSAVPLALSIVGIFYCLARRVANSASAAFLATILFLFNGGLGFIYFLEDWRKSDKGFFEFFADLQTNYANMWDQKIHWSNIIVDCFLPQRSSLYGIPIALIVFSIFAIVWQRWNDDSYYRRWEYWKLFLFAGVLTGALPLFHTHSFVAVGLISGFLFLLKPRFDWLVFWIPAVSLAAFQMISQLDLSHHVASGKFFYWQPSWKGNDDTSWILYWIRNVGVPLLLIVPAWISAPRPWRKFYAAFFCLFVFCFFIMVTPHDYDNIKLFYYWYALSCTLIARWILNLAKQHRQRFLAALFVVASIASGILAIERERLIRWRSFSTEEIETADFVVKNTAPKSVFLTAPINNQPVMCLAGRAVLMGYGGWLWTHGYQAGERENDMRKIYAGDAQWLDLLKKYKVDYIYLSHSEMDVFKADAYFLNTTFPVFYQNRDITIFKVPK